jgi:hypothetical protein
MKTRRLSAFAGGRRRRPLVRTVLLVVAALPAAAAQERVSLIEETIRVPASDWRPVYLPLRQRPATVLGSFVVSPPGSVRVVLMTTRDLRRLEDGLSHQPLLSTGYEQSGGFRYSFRQPGEYVLVIDNRLDARGPADVRLRVSLEFSPARPAARTLSPRRRLAVVALSLAMFAAIVLWSGRRLLRAMSEQRTPGQPPPSS